MKCPRCKIELINGICEEHGNFTIITKPENIIVPKKEVAKPTTKKSKK